MQVRDKLEQEIHVGDFVVYRDTGRSNDLYYGKVTNIKFRTDRNGDVVLKPSGLPYPTIYVRRVTDYSWQPLELASKDSRLTKVTAMVVYPQMPQRIKDLFRAAGI